MPTTPKPLALLLAASLAAGPALSASAQFRFQGPAVPVLPGAAAVPGGAWSAAVQAPAAAPGLPAGLAPLSGLEGLPGAGLPALPSLPGPAAAAKPQTSAAAPAPAAAASLEAAPEDGKAASEGKTAGLDRTFDGRGRQQAPELLLFLTGEGLERPVALELGSLKAALDANPAYAAAFKRRGLARLVLASGEKDPHGEAGRALSRALAEAGVSARLSLESLAVDPQRPEPRSGPDSPEAGRGPKTLLGALTAPLREAAFLARVFAASWTSPTWFELAGGLSSKAPPFVMGLGWWAKSLLPAHPIAFSAAAGLSLGLTAFHGIWVTTWSNFQNALAKLRGVRYQTLFNLAYMQSTSAAFRLITWSVLPGTAAPWTAAYWRDMGVATLAGTYFGSLGFQGVNALYEKGRVPRWGRALIQQARDLFFALSAAFFGTGSMSHFWLLFGFQQAFDLSLYALGRLAAPRAVLYAAPRSLAGTPEFRRSYPVGDGGAR